MAKTLGSLPVGALVKDASTLYYGKPIVWKIADLNHAGFPANSVTLITEKIITLKCFDAIESGNSDSNRKSYGNNRWIYSNIRQWLNSAAAAGKWYSAQHSADAAPTNANVWSNYNEYDQQAGFLAGFSANFIAAMLATTRTVGRASVDGGGTETCTDKVFFATCTEVGLSGDVTAGSKLALFSDNASRIAYPTAEAVSNSEYTNASLAASKAWYWWLADAYASYSYDVRYVYSDGTLYCGNAYYGVRGARPLCNLGSAILVSDSPDSDGAYTIVWNQPPTTPSSLTVPSTLTGGKTAAISWGTSTDPEGSLSGYVLERSVNGGAYAQAYKGVNRSYTDTINDSWNTVQYRVKAYDTAGLESDYKTGTKITVQHNSPPTINGADVNLGQKTGAFSQNYIVTDTDAGQTVTVVEKINGTQKRSYTATSGAQNTFSVTAADWKKLANGTHTLTVTATDNMGGSATRTYTFTKNETEIEFTLAAPLPADAMPTKGIMSVAREIPAGATFAVYACNNGNDANPTWEDVTQAVTAGSKFFFNNTQKTAAAWGFNFKIKVERKTATGDCYIKSVGGNFE